MTHPNYLVISSVTLDIPGAWFITDLSPLMDGPDVRGEDRIIPGAAGMLPFPRRKTVTRRTLNMVILGDNNVSGTPYSDTHIGVETNLYYLIANVVTPITTGDGTRPAVLHLANGSTKSANVHVLSPLHVSPFGKRVIRCTLDLSIPSGSFA